MSAANVVGVGICKAQIDMVCPSLPDGQMAIVLCNVVNVDKNRRVQETAPIEIEGGLPGENCFYLELPNKKLPPEVVVDTCAGTSAELNAVTGRYDYTPIVGSDGVTENGILLQDLKGDTNCFCACDTATSQCRLSLTVWRLAYCLDGTQHPGGRYLVELFPALEYQDTADTETASNTADDGERFVFIAYTRPGWTGPGDIIPAEAGVGGYVACHYKFTTDVCPPGDCNCGDCSGTGTPVEPLAARFVKKSGDATVDSADDLMVPAA